MCRCSWDDRVCATVSRMRMPALTLALLAVALCATFAGSAVATPNVVDQYTEQPPSPGGGPAPGGGPGLNGSPGTGGEPGPAAGGSATGGGVPIPAAGGPLPGENVRPSEGNGDSGGEATGGQAGASSGGESGNQAEPAAGAGQIQSSPAAVESSSLGLGFPIVLLFIAAAVAVLGFRRRQNSARLQG